MKKREYEKGTMMKVVKNVSEKNIMNLKKGNKIIVKYAFEHLFEKAYAIDIMEEGNLIKEMKVYGEELIRLEEEKYLIIKKSL